MMAVGLQVDPWSEVTVHPPAEDAPREQWMEYAAIFAAANSLPLPSRVLVPRPLKILTRLYCERWHPEMELPEL